MTHKYVNQNLILECGFRNVLISGFHNHLQTESNLKIFIIRVNSKNIKYPLLTLQTGCSAGCHFIKSLSSIEVLKMQKFRKVSCNT